MDILLLKLTITPAVIALASLASRRFGPAVGGWLIGLPVTAAPVVLFIALDHGPRFATRVANGFVAGVIGQIAFVLAFVWAGRRGHGLQASVAVGIVGFTAAGLAFGLPRFPLAVLAPLAYAALLGALRVVPRDGGAPSTPGGRTDLLLRMGLATALVLAITTFASTLGATLSGSRLRLSRAAARPLRADGILDHARTRADAPGARAGVQPGALCDLRDPARVAPRRPPRPPCPLATFLRKI